MKRKHKDLKGLECEEPTMEQLLEELKEAFIQLAPVEKGKLKFRPANALLNEL